MRLTVPLPTLRSVRIPPFGSDTATVAFLAIASGAAFMALAISSSSVGGDLAPSAVAACCIAGAAARRASTKSGVAFKDDALA
jgi:hypothetical protein